MKDGREQGRRRTAAAVVRGARPTLYGAAVVVNAFALWLVHDPEGGLGAAAALTDLDAAIVAGHAAAVALGTVLAAFGFAPGGALLLAAPIAMGGLFLSVLPGNWSLALPVVLYDTWIAWTVARFPWSGGTREPLVRLRRPLPPALPASGGAAPDVLAPATGLARLRPHAVWLSGHAVPLIVLVVGYRVSAEPWAVLTALAVAVPALVLSVAASLPERLRTGWRGPWAEWVLLLPLPWALLDPERLLALVGVRQTVWLLRAAWASRSSQALLGWLFAWPARVFALSFLLLILAGGLLLSLPVASATGTALAGVDALFLSVSAVCVTGLAPVDTATALGDFGQVVLLVLVQVGGLGVISLSSFAAVVLGRRLGFVQETALGELIDERRPLGVYRMLRFIVIATFAIEAVGFVALLGWSLAEGSPFGEAAWWSLFHSVSAFCNAGFSLQTDSLISLHDDPLALGAVMVLVVLGGLGFAVLFAAWQRLRGRRTARRLPLHTRVVLIGTVALLVGGFVVLTVVEWNNALAGMSMGERLLNGLFLSVTPRTAGFNTVDMSALAPATTALVGVLMFIGASPGGTGGGVKVTTAIVLALAVRAMMRGRVAAELDGRRVPEEVVVRAAAMVVLSLVTVVAGSILLLATQDQPFEDLMFEAISAFGTVGLSRGATPLLDPLGKSLVMVLMYVGRVGPLTLALAFKPRHAPRHRPPVEYVMVG